MFAHLRSNRSKNAVLAKYQFLPTHIANKIRDNVRNQMPPLTGFDPSNADVAGILAEIHMRELACTLRALNQVSRIAGRYHEHAFDNTDAYIDTDRVQPAQLSPHEMTGEQRHASQILFGVGKTHSEINVALKMLECGDIAMRDVMECDVAKMEIVAKQFQVNPPVAEDAFDRLQHITKQVWSLVNMLAFSNLFRFADPSQPINLPNQDDAIFIPYIPTQPFTHQEPEPAKTPTHVVKFDPSHHVCNECGKKFDPADMHHLIISPETGATPLYLCHACGFKRDFPDEYRIGFPDDEDDEDEEEMNAQYQTHFNEIVEMLADGKITKEQACTLFEELSDEYSK
jgi:DNA-directed RNA polymerase subunit RPC12/RpoP